MFKKHQNRELTSSDGVGRFLAEVHSYPMLKPEEELELYNKYKNGDIEAAKMLVKAHLRLVAKIAMEYRSAYHNVLDLIQEGTLGLMQAVKKFDPEKGARFAHYASWWIKSYILKFIIDNFRLVKIGTTKEQRKLFYNLINEKQKIEAMGYYATPALLSQQLGVKERQIVEMEKRLSQPDVGLQTPVSAGNEKEGTVIEDFIADKAIDSESEVAERQTQDLLNQKFKEFAKYLDKRELKLFEERLLADAPRTLLDIANEFGITKERVRQLEERLIKKLKGYFKESGVDIEELRK